MPQVRVIPPISEQAKKLRVAAYARVSSDSADQLASFATQTEYYTSYIQSMEEWEFAGLYADEAVSGTTTDKRDDFHRLLEDCRAGKIDRILVKSISRFARNTLDCIEAVRELRHLGVTILFEKENLDTSNLGSEMLLSILSAAAQEESLSISKNLKWSYRRRMKSGDFITCCAPLGYSLQNGELVPDPQETPIIQYIFRSYLAGKSITEIVDDLNREKSGNGEESFCWHYSSVRYILENEKYVGDSLMQKRFTPDELPLKRTKNNGQISKYYIQNSHPAIIPREIFEAAQNLLAEKAELHGSKNAVIEFPLSGMMKCGICGSLFHRKPQKVIRWICRKHFKGKELCPMGIVEEREVYQAFLAVYNKLLEHQNDILKPMSAQLSQLKDKAIFTRPDVSDLNRKISELVQRNHALARLQTKGTIDSASFIERCNRNNREITGLRNKLNKIRKPDRIRAAIRNTGLLLDLLEDAHPMGEFDPQIFKSMVGKITVYPEKFSFHLKNGLTLDEGRKNS